MSGHEAGIDALLALMRKLRGPGGCPWDQAQDFSSIAPYTIEEAYEVADAISRQDLERLRDELGDLLFQVVFHARMAEECGRFDFDDVAHGIHDKLVRRHPHVFAQPEAPDGAALQRSWEAEKARERAARGVAGVLADVALSLPALTRAAKLGRRAGRVGFDWPDAHGVRTKIEEELAELDRAVADGSAADMTEELGDLLFTIANWARHRALDPEQALRAACLKFEQRFARMELEAERAGARLEALSPSQWDELWRNAKSLT